MRYEFKHRLYVEYFAAEYLARHPEELTSVFKRPPRYEQGERLPHRFDEVIQTLVQLDSSVEIVKTIAAHDPLLAASCFPLLSGDADARSMAEAAIIGGLTSLMSDSGARENAIVTLAEIGLPAVAALRRLMTDDRPFVRRGAVRALAQIKHIEAFQTLVMALEDSNRWVRDDARAAIRRLDAASRELFVACVRGYAERPESEERSAALDTIEELIDDVQTDFGTAIAKAIGIEITLSDEILTETHEPGPVEEGGAGIDLEDEHEEAESSWGFSWLKERRADPNDPELALAGRTWLRTAPLSDPAWTYVWTELWGKRGDEDLEWLGHDWLQRVPKRSPAWARMWNKLFSANPTDEALAERGRDWLRTVGLNQSGWNHVWRALWVFKYSISELKDLGWWWLDAADPNHESWSIVWVTFWDAGEDRPNLDEIGRRWLKEASPEARSWGFVWQRLWQANPGDPELETAAREWIETTPASSPSWGFIWPTLWADAPMDVDLERTGRQWLCDAPILHAGWGHIWQELWQSNKGDSKLEERGRTWLTAAPHDHPGWSYVWFELWLQSPGDPVLDALAREWLLNAPSREGWVFVASQILEHSPGDPDLLRRGRAMLDEVRRDAWGSLWVRLWDSGGDREDLAPIGRSWIFEQGKQSGAFSFIWQRLWARDPGDTALHDAAIAWLWAHTDDKKWQHVAKLLSQANPGDRELLDIAGRIVNRGRSGTLNWPSASRILSQAPDAAKATIPIAREPVSDEKKYRRHAKELRRVVNQYVDNEQLPEAELHVLNVGDEARKSNDEIKLGVALGELGGILRKQFREPAGRIALLEALDIFTTKKPLPVARAAILHKLGDLCRQQQLWVESEEAYRSSMLLRQSLSDPIGYAVSLDSLAAMHMDQGLLYVAHLELTEALDLLVRYGTERQQSQCSAVLRELEQLIQLQNDAGRSPAEA